MPDEVTHELRIADAAPCRRQCARNCARPAPMRGRVGGLEFGKYFSWWGMFTRLCLSGVLFPNVRAWRSCCGNMEFHAQKRGVKAANSLLARYQPADSSASRCPQWNSRTHNTAGDYLSWCHRRRIYFLRIYSTPTRLDVAEFIISQGPIFRNKTFRIRRSSKTPYPIQKPIALKTSFPALSLRKLRPFRDA